MTTFRFNTSGIYLMNWSAGKSWRGVSSVFLRFFGACSSEGMVFGIFSSLSCAKMTLVDVEQLLSRLYLVFETTTCCLRRRWSDFAIEGVVEGVGKVERDEVIDGREGEELWHGATLRVSLMGEHRFTTKFSQQRIECKWIWRFIQISLSPEEQNNNNQQVVELFYPLCSAESVFLKHLFGIRGDVSRGEYLGRYLPPRPPGQEFLPRLSLRIGTAGELKVDRRFPQNPCHETSIFALSLHENWCSNI